MPDSHETIRVEVAHPVATVTLSRPSALNAITIPMLHELGQAFEALAADPDVAVVILTGEGRAFSAGVDLKSLGERKLDGGSVGDVLDLPARRVTGLLTSFPGIVIAKVNGHCFTGALELALACDVVVAAEEAVFGDTHAKWGLRPTWGMSQRLPLLVGLAKARELSFTGRTFSGADAAAWGMIARAVPRADLDATVADLAAAIAANSRGSLLAYKDLYRAAERLALPDGLAYEAGTNYEIGDTEERIAAFR